MHDLHITVHIQGTPAKRVFVQHVWEVFGIRGAIKLYQTDDNGQVTIQSQTPSADIRIFAQNAVVRMVEFAGFVPVFTDTKVDNHDTVHIDTSDEHVTHFRLLQMAIDCYDRVHRHFHPFAGTDFPFGQSGTLDQRRDQKKSIYIVYPDNLPQPAPFVEPKSLATGYPLLHLKSKRQADSSNSEWHSAYVRLFGIGNVRADIMPHELAHALHFSQLPEEKRGEIEFNYIKYLVGSYFRDGEPFHNLEKSTTEMVAFIEAFGAFSARAYAYLEHKGVPEFDETTQKAFIHAESQDYTASEKYWLSGESQVAKVENKKIANREDRFSTSKTEGAIYGALFLDFANEIGMGKVIEAFYRSQALSFEEYFEWVRINMSTEHRSLVEVKKRWDL